MSRFSLIVLIGIFGCGGGKDDYQPVQPGAPDAATDGAGSDAAIDGAVDPMAADLSIAIDGAPDPVAASSTLTYTLEVTNHGGLDATNVTVTERLPPGDVLFESANGIGWICGQAGQVITCKRATLLVGPAPSIAVAVTTPPVGGPIVTTANVAADTLDSDSSNNDATASAMVLTPADLSIAITDAPEPVAAGGALAYTITVTNDGPGVSTGITVRDSLPASVGFVSASGTGWSCSAVNQDVTCLVATLAVSASSTITLAVTAPTSGGTVSNTASVSSMTPDPDATNDQATTSTTVNAAADLAIAVAASPDPVFGSGTLTYSVNVNNLGPNAASGVTVSNGLPAGNVTFIGASGSGWSCQQAGQEVSCNRLSLLVGAAPTITIVVKAPSESASLRDTATVTSTSSDLNAANNTATVTSSVLSAADLSIAVVDAPDPVTTGSAMSYTITAANAGPSLATSVSATSLLPPGAGFVSASGINWTCNHVGLQVTCTTPQLAVGAAPPITIAVTAPGAGTISETSTVSSATADPVLLNNTVSQTTTVTAPADLVLALTASPSPVPAHATLTYTLDVSNLGPSDASNLTVTNRLPDGNVLFLSATGIGWTCGVLGQIVTCTRPLLLVGAAPSIDIQILTPDVNGDLIDQANVVSTTADLDLANNSASDTTNVFDSADLSITASETPDPVRVGTQFTYTLSVANAGPTAATAVTVVDTLPIGATFVDASGPGWTCGNAGQLVTCTLTGLATSSSAPSITITATAPGSAGTMPNTATVSSSTSDPSAANNTAATSTLANLFADLAVSITDNPDPVQGTSLQACNNNDCVTYTITVTNHGPDPATEISLVNSLPPNGSFFDVTGSGWVCPAPSGISQICTRPSLAVNASSVVTFVWKAPSPGGFDIVLNSTASGSSTDPDPSNSAGTQKTRALP